MKYIYYLNLLYKVLNYLMLNNLTKNKIILTIRALISN